MKRLLFLLVISLAMLALVSCTAPASEPDSGASITGTVWKWQTVTEKSTGSSTRVPNPDVYTIIFNEDGTTNGQADCNTFHGTYSQDGDFTIIAQPDVMAACDLGSLDQQYLTLLGDIVAGGPDGAGGLALETAGGEQRMQFSNGGAAP